MRGCRTVCNAVAQQLEQLRCEAQQSGVAEWVLQREDRKNAIGQQMLAELWQRSEELGIDPRARCVLLRSGVRGVFCAGEWPVKAHAACWCETAN